MDNYIINLRYLIVFSQLVERCEVKGVDGKIVSD